MNEQQAYTNALIDAAMEMVANYQGMILQSIEYGSRENAEESARYHKAAFAVTGDIGALMHLARGERVNTKERSNKEDAPKPTLEQLEGYARASKRFRQEYGICFSTDFQ